MKPSASSAFLSAFQGLRISSANAFRPTSAPSHRPSVCPNHKASPFGHHARPFSASAMRAGNWLEPAINRKKKMQKGRPRVPTGGSTKGTTVVFGDWGLRMWDHHRRVSAKSLKLAEDTIKQRLRGQRYRLYKRVNCDIGVFVSGNEMRMGKGKGSFDHWATRIAVNQIVFELKGPVHEAIVRDAFRLAGNKLPGFWEFVKKGEPPVVGITKLANGITLEDLKRPRKKLPTDAPQLPPAPETPPVDGLSSTVTPPPS